MAQPFSKLVAHVVAPHCLEALFGNVNSVFITCYGHLDAGPVPLFYLPQPNE